MERKQIVSRLGMGTRVVIVRSRFGRTGTVWMRLQVRRPRFGWRTITAFPVAGSEATSYKAHQLMLDYDEYPAGHFRRYP